jgi:hypothetical protein
VRHQSSHAGAVGAVPASLPAHPYQSRSMLVSIGQPRWLGGLSMSLTQQIESGGWDDVDPGIQEVCRAKVLDSSLTILIAQDGRRSGRRRRSPEVLVWLWQMYDYYCKP